MVNSEKIKSRSAFRRTTGTMAVVAVLALVVAACGSDDDTGDDAAPATSAEETTATTTATTEAASETTAAADGAGEGDNITALDADGDGVVRFGVATPGPRDDGAYYQALVEGITAFSSEQGFEEPIIVDNIDPAQAETEIRNLARQGVDVIAVGAGEISEPLAALAAEFPDIFWYCNCGATGQIEGVAQSSDSGAEIGYSAGYATGLLLQDTDSTAAAFLGCCELDFEKESSSAFELGLKAVDESFTSVYIPTGDFNDIAGATEAFNQAVSTGVGAVYPFLGGAHEAVVQLANEADVITMSAGASNACERDDLTYQIAVQFDAGDYLNVIIEQIAAGELEEGQTLVFNVGAYDFVGAKFCDATDEQVQALADANARIAAGELDEAFLEIQAEAYGF